MEKTEEFISAMKDWQKIVEKFIDNQIKTNEKIAELLQGIVKTSENIQNVEMAQDLEDQAGAENLALETDREEGLTDERDEQFSNEAPVAGI